MTSERRITGYVRTLMMMLLSCHGGIMAIRLQVNVCVHVMSCDIVQMYAIKPLNILVLCLFS